MKNKDIDGLPKYKNSKPKLVVVNDDYREEYMENHPNEKIEDEVKHTCGEGQGSWG